MKNIEIKLMDNMQISFGSSTLLKVHKGNKYSFIEHNYVTSRNELKSYVYMVKNENLNDELKREQNNHKRYGVRVKYVKYDELTQNIIIKDQK